MSNAKDAVPSGIDTRDVEPAVRTLLAQVGRLRSDPATLPAAADLHAAGLSSLATVDLMLAIEEHFGVEFPDRLLNRRTFGSIAALAAAVTEITTATGAAP
jgi:acyl carrier protein